MLCSLSAARRAREPDDAQTFRVEEGESLDGVTFGVRDVVPELTGAARHRLEALADRVLAAQLAALLDDARRNFQQSPYA